MTIESHIVLEEPNNSSRVRIDRIDEDTNEYEIKYEENSVDYGECHHVRVELYALD